MPKSDRNNEMEELIQLIEEFFQEQIDFFHNLNNQPKNVRKDYGLVIAKEEEQKYTKFLSEIKRLKGKISKKWILESSHEIVVTINDERQ